MAKSTGKRASAKSYKTGFEPIGPTGREFFSSMVNRGGTENPFEAMGKATVVARLPLDLVAWVDAVAERLGENRTFALTKLLISGLEKLDAEVEPEVRKLLREIQDRRLKAFYEERNIRLVHKT